MRSDPPTAQFPSETGGDGSFQRQPSHFRNWICTDGSTPFTAEPGRYQLYVSLACPWAHRTIIVRALKGLEDVIGMTVVNPVRDERGWTFNDDNGTGTDPVSGWNFLAEAYAASDPTFDGRVTTPTLWDTHSGCIVNNESGDVIRMFNSTFNQWARNPELDLYPTALRTRIDELNYWIYRDINNGVYRSGFAVQQDAYEVACAQVFDGLDRLEALLESSRYLCGSVITESDWRLFVTLVRFDSVYVSHFKCSIRRLVDYPNLWAYTRDLYGTDGIEATVSMNHIKRHYYMTHGSINPSRIVPLGPELDFAAPHGRERLIT